MGIARFERFQNVEIAGTQYLLVHKLSGNVWQLRDTRTDAIKEYTQLELHQMLVEKKLRFPFPNEKLGSSHHLELSDDEKAAIDRKMLYVNAVLELPVTKAEFEQVIRNVWERDKSPIRPAKPFDWTTVYRWRVRYVTFGRDKRALLDFNWLKGNRDPRYSLEVEEIGKDSIRIVYLTRKRNTVAETVLHAQAQVRASQSRLDQEHERNPSHGRKVLRMPERRFIRSLLAEMTEYEKYAARFGVQAARAKFRGVKGHIVADDPLHRVELDSTQIDIEVVDEDGIPMGRPWVTACIDVFTRCALGIYVGFTPPSAEAAIACIKDAIMPKPWLRQVYPDIRNDLPFGVMAQLIVDQAFENHSKQIDAACFWLGVEIHYMARKQPWMKGNIERFMRTLNDGVAHGKPGTTFRSIAEKGPDYNAEKFAVVRLSFLRWAIRKWQADEYHGRPHHALDGLSPLDKWERSIKPEDIPVPHDAKQVEVMMGRPVRRKLTHYGVLYDHLFYNSDELVSLRRREGADLWVELRVIDENLGHLYVLWGRNEAYEAKALRSDYAEGLDRYQHKLRRKYQREHNLPKNPDGWLIAHEEIQQGYDKEAKRRHPRFPKGSSRDRDQGEQKSVVNQNGRSEMPAQKAKAAAAASGAHTTLPESSSASNTPPLQPPIKIANYPVVIRRAKKSE